MRDADTSRPLIGMGCMRLSTDRDRDDVRAIAVLHAAFDAGVTFFDTADAYALDDREIGHNERLVASALASWKGDRSRIVVATKGGLTRPGGNWAPDGRARHLTEACEASRRALGVERIQLYQLHAPDPRTPLATSVRALASVKRDGLVDEVGLCNVTVGQLEEARQIVEIASVQVELSIWKDDAILNGVARYCIDHGTRLIAHRPLGGVDRERRTLADPVLNELAASHGATPFEIALAWLMDLSPAIIPIPGATRVETIASLARISRITFTDADRHRLDGRFPSGCTLRSGSPRGPANVRTDGEVVMIMGLPGAGKSTLAQTFVRQGYARLNRDEAGGTLKDLLPAIEAALDAGRTRVVLDNTYVSRKARAPVVQAAARHGAPVRCVWLATSIEDAQVNVVARMLEKYGRLLDPEEIRQASKQDPGVFPPMALFRFQRELEPPDPSEGFSNIEIVPFERNREPVPNGRAVIVWCDDLAGRSLAERPLSPDDEPVLVQRGAVLRRYASEGWRVLGLSWQPGIAAGTVTAADAEAGFARMSTYLDVPIDVRYCPHAAGPPICWCRKPLPGLGVVFIREYNLDPSKCLYVGDGSQDPGFARRLGFQYREIRSLPDTGI
jgi:aryl-alcohol dehydrogenase-like predicted oxidoreductase/predicted kinase